MPPVRLKMKSTSGYDVFVRVSLPLISVILSVSSIPNVFIGQFLNGSVVHHHRMKCN